MYRDSKTFNGITTALDRGYTYDMLGNIYLPSGVLAAYDIDPDGYKRIKVRHSTGRASICFHNFIGYCKFKDKVFETGIQIRHLNNDSKDNSWNNLELGTPSQNMMDRPVEKRIESALNATSYIRKYNKVEVKEYYSKNPSYKETMEHFGITSKGTLHFILNK